MKKIHRILFPIAMLLVLAISSAANAQSAASSVVNCPANAICNPLKATSVTDILNLIVNVAVPVGAILAVLAFIFVGFKFIAARGNSDKINEAWAWFRYIAIGVAILIGARVVIAIVIATLTSAGVVQPGIFNQ
jgi:hypothetical protein